MLEKYKNKLIAHRGLYDNIIIPENSLRAFKAAIEKNYPIELDIHLTKDNNLVVYHDYDLKRLNNKNIIIETLTTEDLSKLKLLDTKEKIPMLEEVFKLVNSKVPIIIEVKSKNKEPEIVNTLLEKLSSYEGEILIHSFNPKIVKLLKMQKTNYKIGLLISPKTDKFKFKIFSSTIHDIKYSNPDFLSISKKLLNKKHLIKYLNKLPVFVWAINKNTEIVKLNNKNYAYICDNIPYENG